MTDKDTSTLQSYIDKGVGLAQSALGSITGSQADQAQGEQKKAEADKKDELSRAGTNIAGYSVSASGVAPNHPDRQQGSYNQTVGAAKEAVGGALGYESLRKAGEEQNQQGKAQEAQGQLSDLGAGISNRVQGTIGGAIAGLTGDREEQEKRQAQHDIGKTLQRGAEADIQKKAPEPNDQ